MTWIKTSDPNESGPVHDAFVGQARLYPKEYKETATPGIPVEGRIVASHALIPPVLFHAFATFGAAMDPGLPLERRHHEMIATAVSVTNRCRF